MGENIFEEWDEWAMTEEEKASLMWQAINSDTTPVPWPSLIEQLIRLFIFQTDDNARLFEQQTFRPWATKSKAIHSQGAWAIVDWIPHQVFNDQQSTGRTGNGQMPKPKPSRENIVVGDADSVEGSLSTTTPSPLHVGSTTTPLPSAVDSTKVLAGSIVESKEDSEREISIHEEEEVLWDGIKNEVREDVLPYTGMFQEGGVGIISISKAPNQVAGNFSSAYGIGLQMFRSHRLPSTFIATSPDPISKAVGPMGSEWNIFRAGAMCNHVTQIGGLLLAVGARKRPPRIPVEFFTKWRHAMGTSTFATHTRAGRPVSNPRVPFAMCLIPNANLARILGDIDPWEHPIELMHRVPKNTEIFTVLAIDTPLWLGNPATIREKAIPLGRIVTRTDFTPSGFGDQFVFMHHQDFSIDVRMRPDWGPHMHYALLDGFPFLCLQETKWPSQKLIAKTLAQPVLLAKRLGLTPADAISFIQQDIGLGRIPQIKQNVLLGLHSTPSPAWISHSNQIPPQANETIVNMIQTKLEQMTAFFDQLILPNGSETPFSPDQWLRSQNQTTAAHTTDIFTLLAETFFSQNTIPNPIPIAYLGHFAIPLPNPSFTPSSVPDPIAGILTAALNDNVTLNNTPNRPNFTHALQQSLKQFTFNPLIEALANSGIFGPSQVYRWKKEIALCM